MTIYFVSFLLFLMFFLRCIQCVSVCYVCIVFNYIFQIMSKMCKIVNSLILCNTFTHHILHYTIRNREILNKKMLTQSQAL